MDAVPVYSATWSIIIRCARFPFVKRVILLIRSLTVCSKYVGQSPVGKIELSRTLVVLCDV